MLYSIRNLIDNQASWLNISIRISFLAFIITAPVTWYYHFKPQAKTQIMADDATLASIQQAKQKSNQQLSELQLNGITADTLTTEKSVVKKVGAILSHNNLNNPSNLRANINFHTTKNPTNNITQTMNRQNITVWQFDGTVSGRLCEIIKTIKMIDDQNIPLFWNNISLTNNSDHIITAQVQAFILEKTS